MCVHLQPVQLGPQAALVQRLLELHLDPRKEVPPNRAGKWLTHHHGDSAEVHLLTSEITHSLSSLDKLVRVSVTKERRRCGSIVGEHIMLVCNQSVFL